MSFVSLSFARRISVCMDTISHLAAVVWHDAAEDDIATVDRLSAKSIISQATKNGRLTKNVATPAFGVLPPDRADGLVFPQSTLSPGMGAVYEYSGNR